MLTDTSLRNTALQNCNSHSGNVDCIDWNRHAGLCCSSERPPEQTSVTDSPCVWYKLKRTSKYLYFHLCFKEKNAAAVIVMIIVIITMVMIIIMIIVIVVVILLLLPFLLPLLLLLLLVLLLIVMMLPLMVMMMMIMRRRWWCPPHYHHHHYHQRQHHPLLLFAGNFHRHHIRNKVLRTCTTLFFTAHVLKSSNASLPATPCHWN